MHRVFNILKQWLPLAAVTVAVCGLIFLLSQQVLRQSANDPQIQMAEEAAAALAQGEPAANWVPAAPVEMSQSLAPFVMVLGEAGEVVAASARLHGQRPALPSGVLDYVRAHGEDRVTWQPEAGVRIAAVIVRVDGAQPGFVLAGRSLREVEAREGQMQTLAGLGGLATLAGSLVAVGFCEWAFTPRPRASPSA